MRFWDSSALLPVLFSTEATTAQMNALLRSDPEVMVWWGTSVECHSALNRRYREGGFTSEQIQLVRSRLQSLLGATFEVTPNEGVRAVANRLLAYHPLRAADSLQLAAAVIWAEHMPTGRQFVTLDQRLRIAAQQEGFEVLPL